MNLDDSLRDKQITNGAFAPMSETSQGLKFILRQGPNWDKLPMDSKEALESVAAHVAKILHGDHIDPKHWNDIATLARLRGKALEPAKAMNSVEFALGKLQANSQVDASIELARREGVNAVASAFDDADSHIVTMADTLRPRR